MASKSKQLPHNSKSMVVQKHLLHPRLTRLGKNGQQLGPYVVSFSSRNPMRGSKLARALLYCSSCFETTTCRGCNPAPPMMVSHGFKVVRNGIPPSTDGYVLLWGTFQNGDSFIKAPVEDSFIRKLVQVLHFIRVCLMAWATKRAPSERDTSIFGVPKVKTKDCRF